MKVVTRQCEDEKKKKRVRRLVKKCSQLDRFYNCGNRGVKKKTEKEGKERMVEKEMRWMRQSGFTLDAIVTHWHAFSVKRCLRTLMNILILKLIFTIRIISFI